MMPVQADCVVGRRKVFENQSGNRIAFRGRNVVVECVLVADSDAGNTQATCNAGGHRFKIDKGDVEGDRSTVGPDIAVELPYVKVVGRLETPEPATLKICSVMPLKTV